MKTEVKLGEALKELMSKEAIDKITVKRLTDICEINRQTFYYHFRDIYDLLTWIYLNETIKEMENVKTWKDAFRAFFKYIQKNFSFVHNTLTSAGRDLFEAFLYNSIYSFEIKALSTNDSKNILTQEDKRFIASFYTPALVAMIVRWVEMDMKENCEVLLERIDILLYNNMDETIARFARKKEKKQ